VTGVQTCALPISETRSPSANISTVTISPFLNSSPSLILNSRIILNFLVLVAFRNCINPRTIAGYPSFSVVFICAGVTDLRLCEKFPFDTRRINVDATLDLAAKLYAGGAIIVYPSSNAVFDGSLPCVPSDAPTRPTTEYGWQKAKVEQGLLALGGHTVVIRTTKVVSYRVPFFAQWLSCLNNGHEINPLSDLSLSPISLNFLTAALATDLFPGIVHLSGASQVTYAEFAMHLAEALGVSKSLVRPTTVKEMSIDLVYAPRHTSLDMSNTTAALGIEPQTLSAVVGDLVQEFFQSRDSARSERHHKAQNDSR
jgi:dTDP-4-dehydrorhamnose reductase